MKSEESLTSCVGGSAAPTSKVEGKADTADDNDEHWLIDDGWINHAANSLNGDRSDF
jgi:hypothetical protein